jgi:hypothetical protein
METHEVVLTSAVWTGLVRRLANRLDRVRTACRVARLPDRWDWLAGMSGSHVAEPPWLVAVRGTHPEVLADAVRAAAEAEPEDTRIILGVGVGPAAGHLAGVVRHEGCIRALAAMRVIAPGLPRLALRRSLDLSPHTKDERFSRTIGALGERTFARLRSLHFAVVGCGRTGSLVADHLASYGVASIALIDPDLLELHNLGEMTGNLNRAIGRPKALALAERIESLGLSTQVAPVSAPVQVLEALFALKAADVVISCPDNLPARQATARIAALYLKPVLDIGTGIVGGRNGRAMGLDVRWLLPGRCVECIGGRQEGTVRPRLGSLRSLNTWAVGLGFTLIEQFLSGTVRDSIWLQGDVTTAGTPQLRLVPSAAASGCPICRRCGHGDEGLLARDTPPNVTAM